jgi:hypothetical protein
MEGKMTKLTDTQLLVLSKASQRDDRAVECRDHLKGGALKAVVSKLLDRGLLDEIAAKRGMPAWRQDDDGASFALVITRAGLKAIAADSGEAAADEPRANEGQTEISRGRTRKDRGKRESTRVPPNSPPAGAAKPAGFRAGSKRALILSMLLRKGGASIADLVSATGWLSHTTRAALTGLRKRGYALERSRPEEGKPFVYRVVQHPGQWTAA